ncbi:MAG: hypothetical protein ACK46T_21415, partial [Bradyrhizobium sp.]
PRDARIAVIARVSASGEAALRSGDLLGSSESVNPGARKVGVLIDATAGPDPVSLLVWDAVRERLFTAVAAAS